MRHAIQIEAATDPGPGAGARQAALAAQITSTMARAASRRGDDVPVPSGTPDRLQGVRSVLDNPRLGLPARVVAVHHLTGDRAAAIAAGLAAVAGAPWYRVWIHACRHDERQPCGAWELAASVGH